MTVQILVVLCGKILVGHYIVTSPPTAPGDDAITKNLLTKLAESTDPLLQSQGEAKS